MYKRQLKNRLVSQPILALPISEGRYLLDTDASDFGLGTVLSQEQEGCERVIAYASRTLNKAERKYETTRKELLAIVYGLKQYKQYLLGRHFVIRTDHAALSWLRRTAEPMPQLARWLTFIEQFEILHRPGTQHSNADGLSRRPIEASDDDHSGFGKVTAISCDAAPQKNATFDSQKAAAFLFQCFPTVEDIGIGDAEVYSEDAVDFAQVVPESVADCATVGIGDIEAYGERIPEPVTDPTVHTVNAITKEEGDTSGLARGVSPMRKYEIRR